MGNHPDRAARFYRVSQVVEVNSKANGLDYSAAGDRGQTVIAVGGFSLSRGLTLEGLTVTWFLRNTMMYDTLMQMGRWFGYRGGYEDLCRIGCRLKRLTGRVHCKCHRRTASGTQDDGKGKGNATNVRACREKSSVVTTDHREKKDGFFQEGNDTRRPFERVCRDCESKRQASRTGRQQGAC